jgi:hypothetical protein
MWKRVIYFVSTDKWKWIPRISVFPLQNSLGRDGMTIYNIQIQISEAHAFD